jgi:hypothetical protein
LTYADLAASGSEWALRAPPPKVPELTRIRFPGTYHRGRINQVRCGPTVLAVDDGVAGCLARYAVAHLDHTGQAPVPGARQLPGPGGVEGTLIGVVDEKFVDSDGVNVGAANSEGAGGDVDSCGHRDMPWYAGG